MTVLQAVLASDNEMTRTVQVWVVGHGRVQGAEAAAVA
jgi:hypothetical protein